MYSRLARNLHGMSRMSNPKMSNPKMSNPKPSNAKMSNQVYNCTVRIYLIKNQKQLQCLIAEI